MTESTTTTTGPSATIRKATKGKARKKGARLEGERYGVKLAKGDAEMTINVGPVKGGGSILRARKKIGDDNTKSYERFTTFEEAKARVDALVTLSATKGWTTKSKIKNVEQLF